jgi:hypothetical protein
MGNIGSHLDITSQRREHQVRAPAAWRDLMFLTANLRGLGSFAEWCLSADQENVRPAEWGGSKSYLHHPPVHV